MEDKEYDFNEILNAPLPKCPRDTTFTAHWLAVEGVQPAIRQNPPPPPPEPVQPNPEKKKQNSNSIELPGAIVKKIVKHSLSKEFQMYYETLTESIMGLNKNLQDAALESLTQDPGVQQLLPYFVQFIGDQVLNNLRKLPILTNLLKGVIALLNNEHIHIEPYLHQLMPSILTCLVGKRLCANPTEDHWTLRNTAANIIATICQRFGSSYMNLKPRISKTLLHAFLDASKPLTTHYGGIVGLTALGTHTVQVLILPNISAYMKLLQPELSATGQRNIEARKCYGALLTAAGNCLHDAVNQLPPAAVNFSEISKSKEGPSSFTYYEELYSIFGESLNPFLERESVSLSI